MDVGSATFDFACEVREHLDKVHGSAGAWKERQEALKKSEKKEEVVEEKIVWGRKVSPASS